MQTVGLRTTEGGGQSLGPQGNSFLRASPDPTDGKAPRMLAGGPRALHTPLLARPEREVLKAGGLTLFGVHAGLPSTGTPAGCVGSPRRTGTIFVRSELNMAQQGAARGLPVCQGASGGGVSLPSRFPGGQQAVGCCSRGRRCMRGRQGAHGGPRWEDVPTDVRVGGLGADATGFKDSLGMAQRSLFGGGRSQAGREKLRYRVEGLEMPPKQELSTDGDGERGSTCQPPPPHRKAPWGGFMELAQGHAALSALGLPPPRGR